MQGLGGGAAVYYCPLDRFFYHDGVPYIIWIGLDLGYRKRKWMVVYLRDRDSAGGYIGGGRSQRQARRDAFELYSECRL